jgi:two-component system chemotaxis sensor kinase CheA
MDPMEAIKQTFFQECEEQLAELETGLLTIDGGDHDPDVVNAVFRAVHSIKGGAGAFGLDDLVRFAHAFETPLEAVRSRRLTPEPATMRVFLRAGDLLADLVRAAQGGATIDPARSPALEAELAALTNQPAAAQSDRDPLLDFQPVRIEQSGPTAWSIRFRPHMSLYANGNDPIILLRELARLGTVETTLDQSRLPQLERLEPEASYLSWHVTLISDRTETDIRDVFEFVDQDCDLEVTRATTPQSTPAPAELPIASPPPAAPPRPVSAPPALRPAARPTIRVELDRLDRLIDLVGELVINQAVLTQRVAESSLSRSSGVAVGLEELEHLTREIQDSVMAIRAQPVKAVFQRLPRLAREVSASTGKEVRIVTDGEGTEVDNTVIERLADPLTHMIRNAIDHGIEPPEQRVAAGKPAEGTVRVVALHRSGRIVIEVADDGAGIDRKRVLTRAITKGLVPPDAILTDEEIDNLIFAPGFSTAAEVSDISGRGVGMDVVRRSIQALGGRISITSQPGRGSTFSLSLPLTLAVLDGMVVGVEEGRFVIPLTAILETFQPGAVRIHQLGQGVQVAAIRGSYVPLIDVGVALGFRDRAPDGATVVALLVEAENGTRAALLVDVIHGQRQVVIKSLEANYRHVPGVAAATILGDGRVALILDVATIVSASVSNVATREMANA